MFYNNGVNAGNFMGGSYAQASLNFDASRSSSVYQNKARVQPDNMEVSYIIKY